MTDVLTKEQRHKNMKNIRGKDTRIEVILRKALWNKGYRYRKNYKKLPGSPDIALTKYKIAIFCYEGWTVIRFWGEDIKKYTDECVKTVEEAIFDVIICDNDEG